MKIGPEKSKLFILPDKKKILQNKILKVDI